MARFTAALLLAAALHLYAGGAAAQPYPTLASEPDPTSFVKRSETGLTLLGTPMRFGGADIEWLGLRRDGTGPQRRPTEFEVKDALTTLQALGGSVVRAGTLAGTAGCDLCLEPSAGHFNADAFAALDQTLKTAGDLGLHLILPLTGRAENCAAGAYGAGEGTSICAYLGWHGATDPNAFFTDPAIRADFLAHVAALLGHVNTLTGVAYRDDPTILAWENCEGCGAQADPAAVGPWVEAVGQAIKAADHFHLYENGAFSGRILPQSAHPVAASAFATPSVDIVGDSGLPPGDLGSIRATLEAVTGVVNKAGRVYLLDGFDWGPRTWPSDAALAVFLDEMFRQRALAGALVKGLQGHADDGGYLPAPPEGVDSRGAALYFPGARTADMSRDEMIARARALRRFEYDMADVTLAPAYLLPTKPEIVSVKHGRVVWRGGVGALDYTIERSPDPSVPNSFYVVCDRCVTDQQGYWQDPQVPTGPAWYRIMPFNINGHKAVPSAPMANQ
jgi:hypothetical protein